MERRDKMLAFVMAGGEGTRLRPLTAQCCKPAVAFDGHHRVVDFVLSNLLHSGVSQVQLLVQHHAEGLNGHVRRAWSRVPLAPPDFVRLRTPQRGAGRDGRQRFDGTADAVHQHLHLIEETRPDVVLVFGADHIYRMDVGQMVDAHRSMGADATVATVPVPLQQAASFGIAETDDGRWVRRFDEKPHAARAMPGRPGHALASMGNYVFSSDVLVRALEGAGARGDTDFGRDVLPRLAETGRVLAYDFSHNRVPGLRDFEEPAYWRDVGTLGAYFDAQMDMLGVRPRFCLNNPQWPIHTDVCPGPPANVEHAVMTRSVLGVGCVIEHAQLSSVVLRPGVTVRDDAQLDRCIVMEGCVVGRGVKIRRAIVDEDNHIPDGESIGHDPSRDRQRFHVDAGTGIVVVPRGCFRGAAARA